MYSTTLGLANVVLAAAGGPLRLTTATLPCFHPGPLSDWKGHLETKHTVKQHTLKQTCPSAQRFFQLDAPGDPSNLPPVKNQLGAGPENGFFLDLAPTADTHRGTKSYSPECWQGLGRMFVPRKALVSAHLHYLARGRSRLRALSMQMGAS